MIFGYFFLQLATKRLFENLERLEAEVVRLRSHSALPQDATAGSGVRSHQDSDQVLSPAFAPEIIDEPRMLRGRPVGIRFSRLL